MLPSEDETVIQKNVRVRQTTNRHVAHTTSDHLLHVNVSAGLREIAPCLLKRGLDGVENSWGEKSTLISPPRHHEMHNSGHLVFRLQLLPHLFFCRFAPGESCNSPRGEFRGFYPPGHVRRALGCSNDNGEIAQLLGFCISAIYWGQGRI